MMKPVMRAVRDYHTFRGEILTDELEADGNEEVGYEGKEVAARQSFNLHIANGRSVNRCLPIGRYSIRLSSCVRLE